MDIDMFYHVSCLSQNNEIAQAYILGSERILTLFKFILVEIYSLSIANTVI